MLFSRNVDLLIIMKRRNSLEDTMVSETTLLERLREISPFVPQNFKNPVLCIDSPSVSIRSHVILSRCNHPPPIVSCLPQSFKETSFITPIRTKGRGGGRLRHNHDNCDYILQTR